MSTIFHAFMRQQPPTYTPPENRRKRSVTRTAAIVAGGTGLAYGGVQVGRAAVEVRKAAAAAEDAARKHARAMDNVASVSGAVRKVGRVAAAPVRAVKKVFGFAASQGTSVGRDRYVKQIHEKDVDRASGQYVRSSGAGALLGMALRKSGSRKTAALKGAGAGLAAQAITRAGTAQTKDNYGDRAPGAKLVDKVPAPALLAAAITAASPKVRAKARAAKAAAGRAVRRGAQAAPQFAGDVVRESVKGMFGFSRGDALLHGAALAGGITGADVLTNSIVPEKGETRAHAAGKGLVKGAIYGSTLAIAEPAILAALKRLGPNRRKSRAIVPLALRIGAGKVLAFRGRQQLYTDTPTAKGVFADPLKGASGEQDVYTRDEHGNRTRVDLPMGHAQVLRAAMNKGRDVHKWGSRTGHLAGDVADAVRGKRKVDERGRPLKREWEKSYFRNMVGSAVVGAGLLGHAAAMKHKPAYRRSVRNKVGWAKQKANSVVPDLFPLAAKGRQVAFARLPNGRLIAFDYSAPDWDVRDQRGRSARVFAPGSQARDRREKYWHERTSNIRKLAIVGAIVAAAGGGAAGFKLGQTRGVKAALRTRAKKAAATRAARAQTAGEAEDAAIERMKRQGGAS
ncbi:MAG: hypothetical protein QOE70_4674 [Chthoniobacter sp.]|jgi:hypothetical protein|nr:hypothetical protein [Chthoniobacter sp.]